MSSHLRAAVRTRLLCWSRSPFTKTVCKVAKCGRRFSPIVSVSELKRIRAICGGLINHSQLDCPALERIRYRKNADIIPNGRLNLTFSPIGIGL